VTCARPTNKLCATAHWLNGGTGENGTERREKIMKRYYSTRFIIDHVIDNPVSTFRGTLGTPGRFQMTSASFLAS
jgi:hypothetical protein